MFILVNRKPVAATDEELRIWQRESQMGQFIAQTRDGDVLISTSFLPFANLGSRMFETQVFEGPLDGFQWQCATWTEAVRQHAKAVELYLEAIGEDRNPQPATSEAI